MVNVLIVDDEVTIAEALCELLEMEGYRAERCVNGQEAWKVLHKRSFDMLVTDQMMPLMDGVALLARVRKSKRLMRIPALLISALPEPRVTPRTWQAYLVKPFDIDRFLAEVERLVRPAGRRRPPAR